MTTGGVGQDRWVGRAGGWGREGAREGPCLLCRRVDLATTLDSGFTHLTPAQPLFSIKTLRNIMDSLPKFASKQLNNLATALVASKLMEKLPHTMAKKLREEGSLEAEIEAKSAEEQAAFLFEMLSHINEDPKVAKSRAASAERAKEGGAGVGGDGGSSGDAAVADKDKCKGKGCNQP